MRIVLEKLFNDINVWYMIIVFYSFVLKKLKGVLVEKIYINKNSLFKYEDWF